METIITVCSFCKRQRLGRDLGEESVFVAEPDFGYPPDARISHTFCPTCYEIHYGEAAVEAAIKKENGHV